LILRNALDGSMEGDPIYGVNQRTQNIGAVQVQGIDYAVSYEFDVGDMGTINAGIEGTHLTQTNYSPSGAAEVDCLGFYGKTCGLPNVVNASVGGPVPQDHFVQRTTWTIGPVDLSYRWRYLSSTSLDARTLVGLPLSDIAPSPAAFAAAKHIPAYNYIDLSAGWQINDAFRVNANVTNVTNEDPPFIQTSIGATAPNSGNTYPSTYDTLGRVFTIGLQARF
jgi:iron complex outermembrane receptor protein